MDVVFSCVGSGDSTEFHSVLLTTNELDDCCVARPSLAAIDPPQVAIIFIEPSEYGARLASDNPGPWPLPSSFLSRLLPSPFPLYRRRLG